MNYSGGSGSLLNQTGGLITAQTFATATTATMSAAGDVSGNLKQVAIQQGQTGAAVPQQAVSYIQTPVAGVYAVASQTRYRNTDGTGAQTTGKAYTWQGSTAMPASITTTLPTVTAGENGPGTATSSIVVYDSFGRPIWAKDAGGYLTYTAYDQATGAVVKSIADVNTADSGDFTALPTGWTTPSGGGLELITTSVIDALGRATTTTSPAGNVTYTVYNDPAHEQLVYPGWNSATGMPTGPTQVTRDDRGNGYTESFTMSAAPHQTGGVPDGTEAVTGLQTQSRAYRNTAEQVTETDA